jgi:hypothetical protein
MGSAQWKRLFNRIMKLEFTECGLSPEEADALRVGLTEYSDIFAYSSELEDESATTISGPKGTSWDQEYGTLRNQSFLLLPIHNIIAKLEETLVVLIS